jgi:beta-lactamase class A
MTSTLNRRAALLGSALLLPTLWAAGRASAGVSTAQPPAKARLEQLEKASGGRLGVAMLDTASGVRLGHRQDERFPLCSTFKLLLAAAVLGQVDRQQARLDQRIPFSEADLLEYAPVTRARLGEGSLTLGELCEAAVLVSDNTAANLLLARLGGPAAFTSYLRSLGDQVTRLDRNEPMLNEAIMGDERDTTTPAAMLGDLQVLLTGTALSKASRQRLTTWLVESTTGHKRLRAGVPKTWRVGDKTGSGQHGTTNDVAILWPPKRKPILLAVYLTASVAAPEVRDTVLADVGRLVATFI